MKDFFSRYRYLLIICVFLVIISLYYYSYQNTIKIIEDKYNSQQQLVQRSILDRIKHVSVSYQISEKYIDREMKNHALQIRDKYINNPEPLTWNMEDLKRKFSDYNIYIIDSNLKIVNTSDKSFLGFDYSTYSSYARLLRERLNSNSFVSDPMDVSTDTKSIKKYGFISSPDHNYLFQFGIDVYQKFPELQRLNLITLAVKLIDNNKTVNNILLYKFKNGGKTIGEISNMDNPSFKTDLSAEKADLVRGVLRENTSKIAQKIKSDKNELIKYIPFQMLNEDGNLRWETSYVIGIDFNKHEMNLEILRENKLFFTIILIISFVFLSFIYILVRLLKQAEYLAYHDKLTDLPNRKLFQERARELTTKSKKDLKLAFLFIDLDGFKKVNDTYGHDIGDQLLKDVAGRLQANLRKYDLVSRLGGDEFIILLNNISSGSDVKKVANKIAESLKKSIVIEGEDFIVKASIGISIYPEDGVELEVLLKKADQAMYFAKKQGGNYVFFKEGFISI